MFSDRIKRKTSGVETNMWDENRRVTVPHAQSTNFLTRNAEDISDNDLNFRRDPHFVIRRKTIFYISLVAFITISFAVSAFVYSQSKREIPHLRVEDEKAVSAQAPMTVDTHSPVTSTDSRPTSIGVVFVADLDKKSKVTGNPKPMFVSYLQHATIKLQRHQKEGVGGTKDNEIGYDTREYHVIWGEQYNFTTGLNEQGRGCELSELVQFNGKLLTFDDRTGVIYELLGSDGREHVRIIPRHIVMEGDGNTDKGQKHEWATNKDEVLYMGSIGKPFTNNAGEILSDSFLWVATMDVHGTIRHEDWTGYYYKIQKALNIHTSGYVVHEAVEWSPIHRKWFILPRRISTEAYDDISDESRGSNKLVIATEDFSSIQVIDVGNIIPTRGFSSLKFWPGSKDTIIIALKSEENEKMGTQHSYLTVFDISGTILLPETEFPSDFKYEGLAFTYDWSKLGKGDV